MDRLGVGHDCPLYQMAEEVCYPPQGTHMMINKAELTDYLSRSWQFIVRFVACERLSIIFYVLVLEE